MTTISFELFPPKSADGLAGLRETAERLGHARPDHLSVTYGAGGSDRERSFDAIATVTDTGHDVCAHVTCVGQSRADVHSVLDRYRQLGVSHVVALRGDPPQGVDGPYVPHPGGFQHTRELVAAATTRGLGVSVSAYPERHPQSPSFEHDLDVLADKVDAGASEAITQMFFDNDHFLRYRDRVEARGIDVTLVAGIFPVHSMTAVRRFAERCGATMPDHIAERFADDDGSDAAHAVAVDVAAEQIDGLRRAGVDRFHLYTLNRAELALDVCARLGVLARAA